jgi:hypothetical protein
MMIIIIVRAHYPLALMLHQETSLIPPQEIQELILLVATSVETRSLRHALISRTLCYTDLTCQGRTHSVLSHGPIFKQREREGGGGGGSMDRRQALEFGWCRTTIGRGRWL